MKACLVGPDPLCTHLLPAHDHNVPLVQSFRPRRKKYKYSIHACHQNMHGICFPSAPYFRIFESSHADLLQAAVVQRRHTKAAQTCHAGSSICMAHAFLLLCAAPGDCLAHKVSRLLKCTTIKLHPQTVLHEFCFQGHKVHGKSNALTT